MARPKNPNDQETMNEIKEFFSQKYNRNHKRYTYIEFAEDKQIAIDRFKLKLIILKDKGKTFLKNILELDDNQANKMIEDYPLEVFSISDSEAIEDIIPKKAIIDPTLSEKELLQQYRNFRKKLDFGKGIFKESKEKELGSKLADALYIIDCKKYYLSNEFIQNELFYYYGHNIKTDTINKYFEETLELYNNINIDNT